MLSISKMLSFSLVAEALTGLTYHRPAGENSSFQFNTYLFQERPFKKINFSRKLQRQLVEIAREGGQALIGHFSVVSRLNLSNL